VHSQIFFADLNYTYIEFSAAYSFLSLLCDVGGALGLILGSTLLTAFELVDVVVMALLRSLNLRHRRSRQIANTECNTEWRG